MTRASWVNGGAIALSLCVAVAMAGPREPPPESPRDPRGGVVIQEAWRIASLSTVADGLLLELCSPERIVAFTARSAEGRDARRFEGRPMIRALDDIEAIVSLAPDLVITHNVADARRVERLHEAGLRVVDLGGLDSARSFVEDAAIVGALCGAPEAGVRYGQAFMRRMARVAGGIVERRSGMYLSLYGGHLFGGTVGSTYHDVLTAGGLRDAAMERFRGYPQYATEQVLELDPDVIVTRTGMSTVFCAHPALGRLRACPDGMVELDGDLLDDPGPGMLEAAEEICDAVYRRRIE